MASVRTEQELQQAIAALFDSTAEIPAASDDDYRTRRVLMNVAVNRWENTVGILWNELWEQAEISSDGSDDYDCPATFKFPASVVKTYNGNLLRQEYKIIFPHQIQDQDGGPYAYFTGSPASGKRVHLYPAPEDGDTIKFDYYRYATTFSGESTQTEMSDPYYVVHSVVAELHKADRYQAGYTTSLQEAEERIRQMEIRNTMTTWGQEDPIDTLTDGMAFGM